MVVTRLVGGLGNQLFQYAAGRRLADRLGTALKLDLSLLRRDGQRPYALGHFAIRASITRYLSLDFYEGRPGDPLKGWLIRRYGALIRHAYPVIREPGDMTLCTEALHTERRRVVLTGFWQSERYFMDDADALRRDLTLKAPPTGTNQALAETIRQTNAVSLHVRRGDYVHKPQTNAVHGTCSLDYYREAMKRMDAATVAPRYFVFSDDPDWCRQHLPVPSSATFVTHNGADRPAEDLRLMSRCRHHIIANSSFSWWGAWLANAPGGLVVAPARWFAVQTMNTAHLLPPSWIRL